MGVAWGFWGSRGTHQPSCNLGPSRGANQVPSQHPRADGSAPRSTSAFQPRTPPHLLPAGAGLILATALALWAVREVGDIPRVPQLAQGCASRRERDPIADSSLCDGLKPPKLPAPRAGQDPRAQQRHGAELRRAEANPPPPPRQVPSSESRGRQHLLTRNELVQVHLLTVVFVHVQHKEA